MRHKVNQLINDLAKLIYLYSFKKLSLSTGDYDLPELGIIEQV